VPHSHPLCNKTSLHVMWVNDAHVGVCKSEIAPELFVKGEVDGNFRLGRIYTPSAMRNVRIGQNRI